MSDSQDDDFEADVRAAFAETSGDDAPAVEAPIIEAPVDLPDDKADEPADGRVRGPDGKFVAKPAETAQDTTNQPAKVETPPESIRPPASWSAQAKAAFLKPEPTKEDLALIQREVLKREQDVEKGFRERADQLKRYDPLEQLIAPHRSKWQMQGMDETTAIRTLLAAQEMLESQPERAIHLLAQSYGVNLSAQPTQGQAQAPQPAGNSQELLQLQQQFNALQQSIQAREAEQTSQTISAFFADPKNLYAENVRPQMATLLQSGQATDLADAYEKAIWMDPTIRPLLQTPQTVPDRARTERAKNAGASISGAPSNPLGANGASNGTPEDDVRLAIQELSSRA